jgi:di/tricarboxylate transporter
MVEFQKPRFLIKFLAAVVMVCLGTLGMPEKNEAASGPSGGSEEARAASLGPMPSSATFRICNV